MKHGTDLVESWFWYSIYNVNQIVLLDTEMIKPTTGSFQFKLPPLLYILNLSLPHSLPSLTHLSRIQNEVLSPFVPSTISIWLSLFSICGVEALVIKTFGDIDQHFYCRIGQTAILPNSYNCNTFIECLDGVATIKNCGMDSALHPGGSVCVKSQPD